MDDSGEKRKFFLEPEKRTTVVHTDECQEYITKSITGEPPSGWLGPFSTYESAFEYGSNLENKSYPKTCRKCTPWKHAHALEYFMKQAINRMKEYPVLFALGVLLSILKLVPSLIMILVFGKGSIIEYLITLSSETGILSDSPISLGIIGSALISYLLNVLFSPFLTCLYLQVIDGEKLAINVAYRGLKPRFSEFIRAQLSIFGLGVLSLSPLVPIYFFYHFMKDNIVVVVSSTIMLVLYLIILTYIFSALTFSLSVMIIENTDIRGALSLAISFYRDYFGQLVWFGFITNVVRSIFDDFPFFSYYSEILEVFSSLVIIEVFINYQKIKSIEKTHNHSSREMV